MTPLDGLPDRVTVYEVGPRDGLQNEPNVVPVEVKAEFVRRLLAAGLRAVETTSFVSPTWVPQLADAAELMTLLGDEGKHYPVLVPNERGLDRALLGSFTLEAPMDAALVDDHRVFHGVTAVQPLDPAQPAHRDVLVLTFRREAA